MVKFFERLPGVLACMSERGDGSMRRFPGDPVDARNKRSREAFLGRNGIDPRSVIIPELIHGTYVAKIAQGSDPILRDTDGLVTNKTGLYLSVTVADCLPVLFYDPDDRAVGLAHAGWRGLLGGILPNAVRGLEDMGGDTQKVRVEIGPGIQKCHYEIRTADKRLYQDYREYVMERDGRVFVDLPGMAEEQLKRAGVLPGHITKSHLCTYCEEKHFFSYRRDKPQKIEAQITLIGLK